MLPRDRRRARLRSLPGRSAARGTKSTSGAHSPELAKLAELRHAGWETTHRHLQRLRRAYRDDGLADKRKLRALTPGSGTDPRVIAVIDELLAEPRGRSTVARSVMLTQLQRRLNETFGPGMANLAHLVGKSARDVIGGVRQMLCTSARQRDKSRRGET